MNRKQHVYVMALDDFHRGMLERLEGADGIEFHGLLDKESAVNATRYDAPALLARAREQLRAAPHGVDALVGYWDFPTLTMLPILRREFGLRGPTLESALRCEHKYWARLEERRVAPRETPRFAAVDPFAEDLLERPPLPYPFWMKPVRAHSSVLGFRVEDRLDLQGALAATRRRIGYLAEPFNHFLGYAELPEEVAAVDGWHCIAEEIISAGHQCTVEGYVLDGEVTLYGIVDSYREGAHGSCFSRYQYPSALPREVEELMARDTRAFLKHVGFDNAPFNIEFYYDEASGALRLLEVNPRCSKSHSPLFEMVDGVSNLQAVVDVALGREPRFPPEGGRYRCAAKFMLRQYEDAMVVRVPTAGEIAAIERDVPGTWVCIEATEGKPLSSMLHQDSYSYEIAVLFIGADDPAELETKYEAVKSRLEFRLRPRSAA